MGKRYGSDGKGKGKRVEFKRTRAEGDLVTVLCQHTFRAWHGETVWTGSRLRGSTASSGCLGRGRGYCAHRRHHDHRGSSAHG